MESDLSARRITEALRSGGSLAPDASVVDIAASAVGTGQMASCVRLELRFDRETDAPSCVIAKIPSGDVASRLVKGLAIKRLGQPADPVGACLFPLSDDTGWITGQVFR